MELERKILEKGKNIIPLNIKDTNINLCINYEYIFKNGKKSFDGYELVTKNKRNFK